MKMKIKQTLRSMWALVLAVLMLLSTFSAVAVTLNTESTGAQTDVESVGAYVSVYFDNSSANWTQAYVYYWTGTTQEYNNQKQYSSNSGLVFANGSGKVTRVPATLSGSYYTAEVPSTAEYIAFTNDTQDVSNWGGLGGRSGYIYACSFDETNFITYNHKFDSSKTLFTPVTTVLTYNTNMSYYNGTWSEYSGGSGTTSYYVTYGVDSSTSAYGSLTCAKSDGNTVNSDSSVDSGTPVTFTATPSEGYAVEGWYSDSSCNNNNKITEAGTNTEYTTIITQNTEVYVKFKSSTITPITDTNLINILNRTKTQAYFGYPSDWNTTTVYVNNGTNNVDSGEKQGTFKVSDVNYAYSGLTLASNTNLKNYRISNKSAEGTGNDYWTGCPISGTDLNLVGGAFYYITGSSVNSAVIVSPHTAQTSINATSFAAGTTDKLSVTTKATETTSSTGNALKYQYYLKSGSDYIRLGSTDIDASISDTVTDFDISNLPAGNYEVITLLCDGNIYYVSDTTTADTFTVVSGYNVTTGVKVSADGTNYTDYDTQEVPTGGGSALTTTELTAKNISGYKFVGWEVSPDNATQIVGESSTVTYNPTEDVTVYAKYKKLYTITINQPANGTITISPDKTTDVVAGTEVTFTASPNNGDYKFDNWTGSFTDTTATVTKTVTSNLTVSAQFSDKTYTMTGAVANNTPSNATVTPDKTPAKKGDTVTFTAKDIAGYEVESWNVDGAASKTVSGDKKSVIVTVGTSDVTATATYKAKTYTASFGTLEHGTANINGGTDGESATVAFGSEVTINIKPNDGYQVGTVTVTSENVNGPINVTGTDNTRKFAMPAGDVTINITFTEKPTTKRIYVDVSNATSAFTNVAIYYWDKADKGKAEQMKPTEKPNVYYFDVPLENLKGFLFKKGIGTGSTDWGTKTGDLSIQNDGSDLYTLSAYSGSGDYTGTWSVYDSKFTITLPSAEHYNVNLKINGVSVADATPKANAGDVITFTITTKRDFDILKTVTIKDSSGDVTHNKANGVYTFTMPSSNVTIGATHDTLSSSYSLVGDFGNYLLLKKDVSTTSKYVYATVNLGAGSHHFKVLGPNSAWYGNDGTMNSASCTDWLFETSKQKDCYIDTTAAGDYTFILNTNTMRLSVIYPDVNYYIYGSFRKDGTEYGWDSENSRANLKFAYDSATGNYKLETGETVKTLSGSYYFWVSNGSKHYQPSTKNTSFHTFTGETDAQKMNLNLVNDKVDDNNLKFNDTNSTSTYTVTLWFDPVERRIWYTTAPDTSHAVYAKNGTLKTTYAYGKTEVTGSTSTKASSAIDTNTEKGTKYFAKTGDVLTITNTLNDTYYNQGYSVRAFVITSKTKSVTVSVNTSEKIATATYIMPDYDIEITPIYKNSNFTYYPVYLYPNGVNKNWGQEIAVYSYYYKNKTHADSTDKYMNSQYPGEPMMFDGEKYVTYVPKEYMEYDDTNKKWTAPEGYAISGVTFNNNQMDSVHNDYFLEEGQKVNKQTYDFDDFVKIVNNGYDTASFIVQQKTGTTSNKATLLGTGNVTITTPPKSYENNVSTLISDFSDTGKNGWERLTDLSGKDVSILGYQCGAADGSGSLNTENMLRIVSVGDLNHEKLDENNKSFGDAVGQWSVVWYVYDKDGKLITAAHPSQFVPKINEKTGVALALDEQSEAYKAVYNYSGQENCAFTAAYITYESEINSRIDGRWLYQTSIQTVDVNAKVVYKNAEGNFVEDANGTVATATLDDTDLPSKSVYIGTEVQYNAGSPKGEYKFVGWSTTPNAVAENIISSDATYKQSVNKDTTLYAVYVPLEAGEYNITHNIYKGAGAGNGTGNLSIIATVTHKDGTTTNISGSTLVSVTINETDKLTVKLSTVCTFGSTFIAYYKDDTKIDETDKGNTSSTYTLNYTYQDIIDAANSSNSLDFYSDLQRNSIVVNFKYYDRSVVNNTPADMNSSPSTITFDKAIPDSCYDNDNGKIKLNYSKLIDYAADKTVNPSNIVDSYYYWSSQEKAVTGIQTKKNYHNNGEVYPATPYHTDQYGNVNKSGTDADKWVTYQKADNTYIAEGALGEASDVKKITVWYFNTPKKYSCTMHFANTAGNLKQIGETGKYYGNDTESKNNLYYNVRLGTANSKNDGNAIPNYLKNYGVKEAFVGTIAKTAETIGDKQFLYWAYDAEGKNIASTNRYYEYRITSSMTLYAIYGTEEITQPGLTVKANVPDVYDEGGVSYTRLNTTFNPYNCPDNDTNISDIGVIYMRASKSAEKKIEGLSADDFLLLRNQIATAVKDAQTTGLVKGSVTVDLTTKKYNGFKYTIKQSPSAAYDVKLTSKNRVMFTDSFQTSSLANYTYYVFGVMVYNNYPQDGGTTATTPTAICSDNYAKYTFNASGVCEDTFDVEDDKTTTTTS
ncbi:MAG: hypothetical protein MSH11_00350 [Ruminococcus sp.]|nr:hypothetical protein [Ruminococcus sp.]